MEERLHALIVEDSQSDTLLLLRELKRTGFDVDYQRVENEGEMRSALETGKWDIIISDFSMPKFGAPAALNLLQEYSLDVPFIIVSGTIGEEAAVAAMKAGAQDYFPKGRISRLGAAINREINDAKERKRRKDAERELSQTENELRALYNATSVLFKADSLQGLGQQIVRAVVDEFKQFDCGLILVNPKENRLIRLARTGSEQVKTDVPLYLDGAGLVPEAIRSGELIYVPDVNFDSRYIANEAQTKSELVIPLQTSKGIVGVLDLQSSYPKAFSEAAQRVLLAFAERAAVAIEMRALYEEINRYAVELEQRVAQRTAELRQTKEHIEAIFNSSSDAIVLINADGKIQQTNPAFNKMFAYGMDEIFQKPLLELSLPQEREKLETCIASVQSTMQAERLELLAQRNNKSSFDVDIALAPIHSFDNQRSHIICSFRDISAAKELEENLRQTLAKEQELSTLKTRFTAMVSHEFRTPLATIQSSSDLLKHYHDKLSDDKRLDYLNKIQKQIRHLTDLIENVLLVGKSELMGISFAPTALDLQLFCENIADEIQTISNRHQIVMTTKGTFTNHSIDARLLRQMLVNLLSNAIKYSPNGGEICFELFCLENEAIFCIKDNGIGIPEADLGRLFEAFHRAENVHFISGTGLGLAIVKLAVEAHKGTIQVESEINKGTAITVKFPKRNILENA